MIIEKSVGRLQAHLSATTEFIHAVTNDELDVKKEPNSWSKKEVLGHLIDSGINNLQRFTEIQFTEHRYVIRTYNQNELVRVNKYLQADINDLLLLWVSLKVRIISVISSLSEAQLHVEIEMKDQSISSLHQLIQDYLEHMEHHLNQIGVFEFK